LGRCSGLGPLAGDGSGEPTVDSRRVDTTDRGEKLDEFDQQGVHLATVRTAPEDGLSSQDGPCCFRLQQPGQALADVGVLDQDVLAGRRVLHPCPVRFRSARNRYCRSDIVLPRQWSWIGAWLKCFHLEGKRLALMGSAFGGDGKRLAAKGSASATEGKSSGAACLFVRSTPCEQICLAQVVLERAGRLGLFCSRSVLHCAVFCAEPPRYLAFLTREYLVLLTGRSSRAGSAAYLCRPEENWSVAPVLLLGISGLAPAKPHWLPT
jgi:hypothetical protein